MCWAGHCLSIILVKVREKKLWDIEIKNSILQMKKPRPKMGSHLPKAAQLGSSDSNQAV